MSDIRNKEIRQILQKHLIFWKILSRNEHILSISSFSEKTLAPQSNAIKTRWKDCFDCSENDRREQKEPAMQIIQVRPKHGRQDKNKGSQLLVFNALPLCSPAIFLGFTILGETCVCDRFLNLNIEVVTFHLCVWYMLGVFLLPYSPT